ncbi:MAG: PilZ domain-containing protein [Bdellovibrionota bacterium]
MTMKEMRNEHRFDTHIGIVIKDAGGLNFGFIKNMSKSGAFIETKKSLPIGTPIEFVLSNGTSKAEVYSRVIRILKNHQTNQILGVGVSFAPLVGAKKFVRDDLLLCCMTKKYLEMWDQPSTPRGFFGQDQDLVEN